MQLLQLEISCGCVVKCFLSEKNYGLVHWALYIFRKYGSLLCVNACTACSVIPGYKTISHDQ